MTLLKTIINPRVLTLACAALLLCSASAAQAQDEDDDGHDDDSFARFMLGVDVDYAYAISLESIDSGGGGALRLGSELDLILVSFIPEAYIGYHAFDAGASVTSGRLGGRIRIGKILEPGLYAHLGIARVTGGSAYTAPVFDGGFTLDFTLLPLIDIGAHAAYNAVFAGDQRPAFTYATFGLHAALII
jgi:hypothetical protein